MAENPPVHSKGDNHGMPRTAGHVESPGAMAEVPAGRHAPSSAQEADHGRVHHYEPGHPAMGGMHAGAKAVHPTHDADQAAYEGHGHLGKR